MTDPDPYTERLKRLSNSRWKNVLSVQAPYRWNLRRLEPERVLDVGCGIGRNLLHLNGNGVGVDTSRASVDVAKSRGCVAYAVEDFAASEDAVARAFDSLLFAHVLEHMSLGDASNLVREYLPYIRPSGQVIVIVPQEAGYASDSTHVNFLEASDIADLMDGCGLAEIRDYSFPFPRAFGRVFRYNETVVVGRVPDW
jgi:2-polyprenyl-3-methyl-5-hydroxy-6-metoxy-1,4-benzoquinol methylase